MNQAETDKPDPKVWQSLAVFRPQQPMRHKAAGLAKRLARHASQAHVLARAARQKAGRLKMARLAAAARVLAHLHLPERLRLRPDNRVAAESNGVPPRPDSQP